MFMPQLNVLAVLPLPESSVIVVLPEESDSKVYSAHSGRPETCTDSVSAGVGKGVDTDVGSGTQV